jgi:hypothetical protein
MATTSDDTELSLEEYIRIAALDFASRDKANSTEAILGRAKKFTKFIKEGDA